jgi:hypothetical protein
MQTEKPLTPSLAMNRNVDHCLGVGKAALKPPALQTLARGTEPPGWREAFGVRAALAPLSLSREANPRFGFKARNHVSGKSLPV